MSHKKSLKSQNIIRFVLLLAIVALLNVLTSFLFTRIDLTTEKRFTLSQSTKELLKNLKDIVYIKVYLAGEMPAGFQNLSTATRDMLSEMKSYGGSNFEFEFIDPSASPDQNQRNELYNQLAKRGLQPTNIQEKTNDGSAQRILFPGAIVNYLAKEQPMQLLKDRIGVAPAEMINNSIQNLEYEITNTIKKITDKIPPTVAFVKGHGEMPPQNLADIQKSLTTSYDIKFVELKNQLKSLDGINCIVVAKPDTFIDEKDKFIIDQFIMRGGKVLWLIDAMHATMDSLAKKNEFVSVPYDLNIDDMLFRYGVRINPSLVMDLQSVPIPVLTGYVGNRPQNSLLPWYFFPLVTPESKNVIVNNLNAIKFEFASSLDTIASKGISKTILLTSSAYSRQIGSPAVVNLNVLRTEPDERLYNQPNIPLAVLLEGKFTSNYANRIPSQVANDSIIGFRESGVNTKMIVVTDGDVIKNEYRKSDNSFMPLGFDKYTGQFFGNKNFILNCIDYLCDSSGLMALRAKEFKLRLLDKKRFEANLFGLKLLNVVGPILLIILLGLIKTINRKNKFAR